MTTRWVRRLALLLMALLALPLLAACGDDDGDDSAGDTPTATVSTASGTTTSAATPATAVTPAGSPDASPDTGSGSGELTSVRLALDWYPWSQHTGIYLALERGYFEAEGLDVEVYVPGDPTTALQLVATGEDDFAISYQADVLIARSQGLEVKSVAALVQHPFNTIMALESAGIDGAEDLAGTTIGITGVPSDEALLGTVLEGAGLSLDDVELVNVGFDLMPALFSEQVDAIIGAYWVHESILAEQQGQPVTALRLEDLGVPDYYELVLVASDETVSERSEVVAGFVRALQQGYADAEADPDAAVDALLAASPETDEAVERAGIELVIPYWTSNGSVPFGTQTAERWDSWAGWLQENGILEGEVDVDAAWTGEFVE